MNLTLCVFIFTTAVNSLVNTSISDVIKLIEFSGIDEDEIHALTEYLREAFQAWVSATKM